jgi:hypothetical protein
MKSTSETGHLKNIENFSKLLMYCEEIEDGYFPESELLQISELRSVLENAYVTMENVVERKKKYDVFASTRLTIFKPLRSICTRVLQELSGSEVKRSVFVTARSLNARIQGRRLRTTREKSFQRDEVKLILPRSLAASQYNYLKSTQNFERLIELLKKEKEYKPVDRDLKIESLTKLLKIVNMTNEEMTRKSEPLSRARIERDFVLYAEEKGMLARAMEVKKYLKSRYGLSHQKTRAAIMLRFVNRMYE